MFFAFLLLPLPLLFVTTFADATLFKEEDATWRTEQLSSCEQPGFDADDILELITFLWDFFMSDL